MDKLKLAHDYALKQMESLSENSTMQSLVSVAWQYADAMQAEADKREDKTRPEALLTRDKDGKCLHFHHEFGHKKCMDCGASLEEWQPDWSQAPEWANYIAVYSDYCNASYFEKEPKIISGYTWGGTDGKSLLTPIPVYAGNWQDSLRKRPESLCEVDWSQAPGDATAWEYLGHGSARWHTTTKGMYRAADLFGYSGTDMLLVERPHGF